MGDGHVAKVERRPRQTEMQAPDVDLSAERFGRRFADRGLEDEIAEKHPGGDDEGGAEDQGEDAAPPKQPRTAVGCRGRLVGRRQLCAAQQERRWAVAATD